jgi:hypothetical protein
MAAAFILFGTGGGGSFGFVAPKERLFQIFPPR